MKPLRAWGSAGRAMSGSRGHAVSFTSAEPVPVRCSAPESTSSPTASFLCRSAPCWRFVVRSVPYCGSRYAIPRGSRREEIIVGADDLTRYPSAMDSRPVRPRSTKQQI